jgi:hypothetical protein
MILPIPNLPKKKLTVIAAETRLCRADDVAGSLE